MTQQVREKFELLVKKRDDLDRKIQRMRGKLEAEQEKVSALEKECRDKGLDPDKLPSIVEALEKRTRDALVKFEEELSAAETALAPYLKEI